MASATKQYRILLFGNSGSYDKKYVETSWFQTAFKNHNWSKNPFKNVQASTCLSIGLIKEGVWFSNEHLEYEWAYGAYLHLLVEVMPLNNPIIAKFGSENVAKIPTDWWTQLVETNPQVISKIKAWKILYADHLINFKSYSDLRYKALKMPWGYVISNNIKNIENLKNNFQYKIDKADSQFYDNVRCRACYNKVARCTSCEQTTQIMQKRKKESK